MYGRPIARRLGEIALAKGDLVVFRGDPDQESTREGVYVSYRGFVEEVPVDSRILIDDGYLEIMVRERKGDALICEALNDLYLQITRKYYGHDKAVCIVDDEMKVEWAYIPHFYYDFYVYQYATAFTASAALSEKVLGGDQSATKQYLMFLSSGSSDYPINLLKKAGVDMTTSQPLELTMRKMNRVMDEMEKILDKMKR